ncbi:MAG TPA: EAL domain-containing protein, partial [Candidatus Sumerlaeota bacterium]|nr:EAL domain-containing protein [Candidatus Sumerlaeota bacterium]
ELIGRITVQSYTLGKYTDNDLNLLNVIADQCSAAIARTQAEEALHEREELYRRAIAVADAVPYQRDYAEDVFLYMGEGITNLTGYPPQDFTTKVMKNIVQECILMGECEGMTLLEARNFCRSGSVREWRAQYRIRTAQGEERWIEDSSIQLFDPAGTVTGSLGLLRNITEQKRMEKERQVLQRLSQSLTGCRSAREVGQQVAVAAKTLFQYDAISLFNIFLDDSTIDAVYSEDILSDLEEPIEIPLSGSTIKLTKSAGELSRPSLVNRHDSDPIDPGFQVFGNTARRSRSLMFVPILLGDNLVGRLTVQSYTHGKYRESDLRLLQALAEHCGAALARTRVEAELHDREERYRLIVETAEEGVWVTDARGHTIFVNTKLSQMLGFSREEMMGLSVPSFMDHAVHPAATTSLENRRMAVREQHDVKFRRKDGSPLWTILTTSPILDSRGHFLGSLAMVTDITDRKHAEEQLLHDAFHDVLTGLPNRALFLDRLGVCLEHIKRRKDYFFAVLFLDLDRFKNINDSLGHFVGDQLLREVARRIEKSLRPGDTIARLGGDEFCLLLDDLAQVSDAILVAERIQNDLTVPVVLGNHEIFTSASIGIAISSSHYEKPEELLRDADTAMYRAKAQGRMRHEIFDPAMHQTAVELLQLESDLRRAVERHEFEYYYQPIVSIGNGMIVGLEALLRWNHPTRGHLAPADFLHIAEETGLIMPICWQLLGNACLQVRRWQMLSPDLAHLTLSVNLSSKQFSQPDLYDSMRQILKDTDLPPRSLILEITESIIMKHAESTISLLDRLKDLNLQIHIDDFGTGYSSLSYLHRFPVDAFKIDASFVMNMDIDQVNAEIVRTIIDLAKGLSLSVTAEGVEKEEQIKRLHQLGCGLGQGNYFSPPLSAFDVEKLLREVL